MPRKATQVRTTHEKMRQYVGALCRISLDQRRPDKERHSAIRDLGALALLMEAAAYASAKTLKAMRALLEIEPARRART